MTISDEEHVARAIWSDWLPGVPWDSLSEDTKSENLSHARAAIAAMREREGVDKNINPTCDYPICTCPEEKAVRCRNRSPPNPADSMRAKTIDECEAIAGDHSHRGVMDYDLGYIDGRKDAAAAIAALKGKP